MRLRFPRPRNVTETLRDLARRRPDEAEAYLDAHQDEWEEIAESTPENAADILEALEEEGAADLLKDLDPDDAGEVLDEMRPEAAADVLEAISPARAAEMIAMMDADQAADVIAVLDPEGRTAVLAALDKDAAAEILNLLAYAADTAGGMMTTDFAVLPAGAPAGESIEALRRLHEQLGSNLAYVYVTDDRGLLRGVVSFRDIVFARPADALEDVMLADPVSVNPLTDREVVAELMQRYHLLAIPVVSDDGRLVGMVKVSEALEAIQAEAGEDIALMVGAGEEETIFTPVSVSVRRRLPWIAFNLVVGVVLAFVIAQFESVLAGAVILAAYMPLVALLGGNSGAQSLAVIIRSIAIGDLPRGRARRAVRREMAVTAIDAIAIAILAAIVGAITVRLFGTATGVDPWQIAVILFVSVIVSISIGGVVGASIPIILRRLGQDPALASNIFLTMTTDLVSFASFLITAAILL